MTQVQKITIRTSRMKKTRTTMMPVEEARRLVARARVDEGREEVGPANQQRKGAVGSRVARRKQPRRQKSPVRCHSSSTLYTAQVHRRQATMDIPCTYLLGTPARRLNCCCVECSTECRDQRRAAPRIACAIACRASGCGVVHGAALLPLLLLHVAHRGCAAAQAAVASSLPG